MPAAVHHTALPDFDDCSLWEAAEEPFASSRAGAQGQPGLVTRDSADGARPVVCFTAPHAVEQHRDGRVKYSEPYTAALALLAADTLGQAAVAVAGAPVGDANWDAEHPLKHWLTATVPGAVVDLHMMRDEHGLDVCLGLGANPVAAQRLLDCLLPALEQAGLRCAVNAPFDASRATTVTSHAQALGCEAIQIEVAVSNLMGDPARRAALARAVLSGVDAYLRG